MRYLTPTFFISLIVCSIGSLRLNAQPVPACQPHPGPISFKGTAPSIWAIDGDVMDWQTILGSATSNEAIPYLPKRIISNWALETPNLENLVPDPDTGTLGNNLVTQAFVYDDYNIYFYFRRMRNTSDPMTFYYWLDVNTDGFMGVGEPVIRGTFNNQSVTSLTLNAFMPDSSAADYLPSNGNSFISGSINRSVPYFDQFGFARSNFLSSVNATRQNGRLNTIMQSDLFHAGPLSKQETFSAAVTENGYGIELSVPWSLLKIWNLENSTNLAKLRGPERLQTINALGAAPELKTKVKPSINSSDAFLTTRSLRAGQVFFYKLSLQKTWADYDRNAITDNMGDCWVE
jgi:hypothetical protein